MRLLAEGDQDVQDADLSEIEGAIRRMDGSARSTVTLEHEMPVHMCIGGGEMHRYIVYATLDDMNFINAIEPRNSSAKIGMTIGGQLGEYNGKQCVSLETALKAARAFALKGEFAADVHWAGDEARKL